MTNQINNQSIVKSIDVIQLTLTLKMTAAQVVETSVTVNNNSPIQNYVHLDNQIQPTFETTPGFKPSQNFLKLLLTHKLYHFWSVFVHLSSQVDNYLLHQGIFYVWLLDCVHYNEDFIKSRFCSIHFTIILARLKGTVRHTKDFIT